MIKIEKFDGTKTYMFPNGEIATPARLREQFPAIEHFVHVIEVNGEVCQAVMNLSALRNHHKISDELTESEAIAAIEVIVNTPEVIDNTPTADERIAAAMEYDNLMKY